MIARLICLLALLSLSACSQFNDTYAELSKQNLDNKHQFHGAWTGEQIDSAGERFPARAALTEKPDGTVDVFLEMPQLGALIAWYQFQGKIDVVIYGQPYLMALSPISHCDEHGVWALALDLQAHREGEKLVMLYTIRDALQDRATGQMILYRAAPAK